MAEADGLGATLARRIAGIEGVREAPSRFTPEHPAFHVGRREVAHFHDSWHVDIRVGRQVARAWQGDPRVVPRRSASEWLELELTTAADVDAAFELVAAVCREASEGGAR